MSLTTGHIPSHALIGSALSGAAVTSLPPPRGRSQSPNSSRSATRHVAPLYRTNDPTAGSPFTVDPGRPTPWSARARR